jgi:hypothetical protein
MKEKDLGEPTAPAAPLHAGGDLAGLMGGRYESCLSGEELGGRNGGLKSSRRGKWVDWNISKR